MNEVFKNGYNYLFAVLVTAIIFKFLMPAGNCHSTSSFSLKPIIATDKGAKIETFPSLMLDWEGITI